MLVLTKIYTSLWKNFVKRFRFCDYVVLLKILNTQKIRLEYPEKTNFLRSIIPVRFYEMEKSCILTNWSCKKKNQSFFYKRKPNCEFKWDMFLNKILTGNKFWGILQNNFANTKAKQLQWKIVHNIIYTEDRL